MAINSRVIPEWRHFASLLAETIQESEHQSDGFNRNDKEETLFLKVHPNIQFHYSCASQQHLHCITSYTGCSGNVVLGFKWGQTEFKHEIDMWVDDGQGSLQHYSTFPVYGRYKIQHMLFIPSRGVLVAYCNDMCLRILTDKTQEMVVLYQAECPASVVSMHYCLETNEILTGSMGLIAFWSLFLSPQSPLILRRVLDWTSCSLQRDTVISAFVSQRQTNSIYALCNRSIKSFDASGEKELFEFRGQSYSTLRCVVTEWRQRYLYTGDAEGYMQVWSYDTRRLFLQFRAHANAVTSVVLLPESGTLLSASTGCWIKQWTRTGDLLLKLHTDMPGVRSMWKLGKNVILCQSSNSLHVWRLNSVYRSFNDTACSVRVLRRLDCCEGKALILAVTQDGIIRFFSPVTGDLLFLSWPFLHIDKALSFAYHPSQEELYICDGSVEVLVLNTTLSPCPVKHVINTVKDGNDGVLCLATVLVWSSQAGVGNDGPLCLVFSGHCNGKLQLLAPLNILCEPKQAHSGEICQMSSSNARKTPLICCYGTDNQFTLWSVRFGESQVDLSLQCQISCQFTPVHCRVLQGFICAVSPQQNLILYSIYEGKPTVIERKRSERISCLDYCPQLDIMAVSAQSGKLEIWNPDGNLVAEVQLGVPVTQVCFGNTRGDILASFSDSISIMPVTHFLPSSYLRTLLQQAPTDDVTESAIPFLPKSPSHYDISLVAKICLKYVEMESVATERTTDPITNESKTEEDTSHTEVLEEPIRKPIVRPFTLRTWRQSAHTRTPPKTPEQEPGDMNEVSREALTQVKPFEDNFLSFFSLIAPDGYIPNSVVRVIHTAEEEEEEEEKEEEKDPGSGLPAALFRDYEEEEEIFNKHSKAIDEILTRTKMIRMQNAEQKTMKETTVHIEEQVKEEARETDEIPEEVEQEGIQTVLTLLDGLNTSYEYYYIEVSDKLHGLLKKIQTHDLLDQIKQKYVSHLEDPSLSWRQFEGLNNLRRMSLLHKRDVCLVAKMLTHPLTELSAFARTILKTDFNIWNKKTLRKKLHGFMSPGSMEALLEKLTEDLLLIEDDNYVVKIATEQTKSIVPRKFRKSYKLYDRTTVDFMGEEEKQNKDKKHTEMPTGEPRQVSSHTPKPKRKSPKRAYAKWDTIADVGRSRRSSVNPLLYAFRKSRTYGTNTLSPKYESRLLPIDSGFGSLVSEEVSPKQVTTGDRAGFLPIGKPTKLVSKARDISQDTSQFLYHSSQHSQCLSQHHLGTIRHHNAISQPRDTVWHYGITSQHPHDANHHYDITSQHAHDDISKYPPGRAEHPQDSSHHPRHISKYSQRAAQHDGQPHHASQALDVVWWPSEQGEVREQGDTHWRESLHKLISLYGFRSRKAAKAAASLCAQPLQLRTCMRTTLPPLHHRPPPWQGALGERVTERVELTEGGRSPTAAPLKFQHEIPLPWRLSHFPLKPQGQARYGKLEMDWVTAETDKLTLPKIDHKRSLVQA
ncbi:hypothetical protein ACEWY4_010025 [Coilia grayii]|uniref:Uncharacterized protein n=1 Tax=Coilia grayii TaxID=363190 RepID=A0ABD1K856_9TELE